MNTIILTDQKFSEIFTDISFCQQVANAHVCTDKNGVFKHLKTCSYPTEYIVTDEQKNAAIEEFNKQREKRISVLQKNTIYFIGMGMNFEKNDFSDVENFRIRTKIQNAKGCYFVEFSGDNRQEAFFCHHSIYYPSGFNNEEKRDEQNNYKGLECQTLKGYNKENILNIVNNIFDCNFKNIEIDQILLSSDNVSISD